MKPISRHLQLQRLREQNLRAVRDFNAELARHKGKDRCNEVVALRQGGYCGPASGNEWNPMKRFIGEDGPWTTFSTVEEGRMERVNMRSEE